LRSDLRQRKVFEQQIFPTVARQRLRTDRIGLVAVGGLPGGLLDDLREALAPTGARLVSVSVLRVPPDLSRVQDALKHTRFSHLADDPSGQVELGRRLGVEL